MRLTRFLLSRACAGAALALILGLGSGSAPAHDIPNEIVVQTFVKPEGARLHVLVRLPLVMVERIGLPKRGPGYLDLAAIDHLLFLLCLVLPFGLSRF